MPGPHLHGHARALDVAVVPHVVVVGGGFGGLYCARALAPLPVRVTLLDRTNHHLFQPLLYQVATAGLSPGDIASPIRALLARHSNVTVRLGEVEAVDLPGRSLTLREVAQDGWGPPEALAWDFLVLAPGVRHSYFGRPEWEQHAPGLKTLDDALELRRRVLTAFERAETTEDPAERDRLLTFVVVGGGPTGVELAGAIAELARFTVAGDFRNIEPARARVLLCEAGDRILPAFDAALSQKALSALRRLGVDVRLGQRVTALDGRGAVVGGERVEAATILWGAGVEAPPLMATLGVPLDRAGRVPVEPDLSVPGHPRAFVIGDAAAVTLPDGRAVPALAPAAIQEGRHAAKVIAAALEERPREPFRYLDKGIMATVGRAAGIAQSGPLRLSGFLGWLAWLFIHILFLIGFRNRLFVLLQWTWAWFTYGRGTRLITGAGWAPARLQRPMSSASSQVTTVPPATTAKT